MANKKNRKNSKNNTHKHVYQRKKLPNRGKKNEKEHTDSNEQTTNEQTVDTDEQTTDTAEQTMDTDEQGITSLEGNRIMNLDRLQQYTDDLTEHSTKCDGSVILSGETRAGLASILTAHCSTCDHTIRLETSKKVKGPRGYSRWACNLAAVWGQMSTGVGHSQLEESMSVMGIPVMTKTSFIHTERDIGLYWKEALQSSMAEAGQQERRIAEEKGSFHEGVPAITVIVDGGWSKRSHKHSYNAKSGVGVIIGKETGKLLFIGVRNKYCHACARGIAKKDHTCFQNWSASSSEMETDIILEGFLEAEKVHGVRYTQFIGDGDSSVYPTLLQNVPGWGYAIKKLECANHACKCYRGALEKLVQDNPSYKGSGRLHKTMRKKLVSAARCAIRMRSTDPDSKKALQALRKDLLNGPRHCFGIHTECSADFCTTVRAIQQPTSSSDVAIQQPTSSSHDAVITGGEENDRREELASDDDLGGIVDDQESYWRDTLADTPAIELEVRQGGLTPTEVDPKMFHDIQAILSRLVGKAEQLLGNHTTNLAECWMHIRSKFDGGKVINRSQSGSWEHRCMGAGLRQNMGMNWGPQVWTRMTTTSPNKIFADTADRSAKRVDKDRKRKATDKAKESRRKSKYMRTSDNTTAARSAYSRHDGGISPEEVNDDIPWSS